MTIEGYDNRVLLVAPTGRDSVLLAQVLTEAGFTATPCTSVLEACAAAKLGTGALLVGEEALGTTDLLALNNLLDTQPDWSDLPVLIMVVGGKETVATEERARQRADLHLKNVTLLERPIRMATLISSIEVALRGRRRQYEIRANLDQRATAQEAVRRSEKLAVAGRLAASIAHEINNPLESVTNLLYLINASDDLDQIKMFARTAEQELARVSEITTQTLRFHRQQTNATEVCLGDIIDSVLALFHGRLSGAKIRIARDFRTKEKILVYAGEIRQVIANLIQNALDAMQGGGTLHLRVVPVARHGVLGTAGVRVLIGDSGSGIPERIRTTLFEPFVTTKGATGTGLGLWVSRELIEKHQGELRFRTSQGAIHGTVFSLFLPAQRAGTDRSSPNHSSAGAAAEPSPAEDSDQSPLERAS